jgi:ribonuclease R
MQALIPELKTRLASRRMQLVDLYQLLFENEDKALQQEAYENLRANVQDAASIISMATAQQENWESFEYLDMQQSQTAPFYAWLEIKIKDSILTTVHPSEHKRKQSARHLACLSWIEAYLKDALVSPEQRVQPELKEFLIEAVEKVDQKPKEADASSSDAIAGLEHPILSKPLKDGQKFISLLMEVCQGLQWPSPEFEFQEEEGYFICECQLMAMGQRFVGEASATKKQRAKHLAARVVMEQLQGQV